MTPERDAIKQALKDELQKIEKRMVEGTSFNLLSIGFYLHTSALWEIMDCQDRDWKASRKSGHYEYWGKAVG